MTMREIIANQVSISEQEDAYAALEAKYNNVEEAVEQDLLRAQFDRVDEDFEGQDMLAAQLDGVEDIAESGSGFVEECEDFVDREEFIKSLNVIEENYIEEDDLMIGRVLMIILIIMIIGYGSTISGVLG